MTRRDWVLVGTAYLFLGAGLPAWMAGDPTATIVGALAIVPGLVALYELTARH